MSKAKSFTSIRELPSGRFQARYRPRNGAGHICQTFDTREAAGEWLEALRHVIGIETVEESDLLEFVTRMRQMR